MSTKSGIEWTDATWNPVTGCSKVSPGCDRCYAERVALRFPKTFPHGFAVTLRDESLSLPYRWRRSRLIFVNSMSDLWHAAVPDAFIQQVFEVMSNSPRHTFQVLTKRAERLARMAPRLPWPENVWMGVSVESSEYLWRVDYLRRVPATIRYISAEPLLGPLGHINLDGIQWLVAGGESQPGARPAQLPWFRSLRDQCGFANVPFFLKQLGGHPSKRGGDAAVLDGSLWRQLPIQNSF